MDERSSRVVRVLLLGGPLGLVLLVRTGVPAPASAAAHRGVAPIELAEAVPVGLSGDQARALEWITARPVGSGLASPLASAPSVRPLVEESPVGAEGVSFTLRSVVGSGLGGLATINGKIHRVGDEVAPGWRLVEIDARHRHVKLSGPDGEQRTVEQD